MILFDDRQPLILRYFAVSAFTTFVQSCAMSSLIQKYETEESVLDWFKVYITCVLDVRFHVQSVYEYFTKSKLQA